MKLNFVFLICFYLSSCNSSINHVSYSFVNYGNYNQNSNLNLPRNKFINYDNYIFEFILRIKIDTYITKGEVDKVSETTSFDTIGVIVHNIKSKTFTKIWPFDSSFKIIERNIAINKKSEGFMVSLKKGNTDSSFENNSPYKNKIIDGLKLVYSEYEDSGYQTQVYYVNKNYFKSPYELYFDTSKDKYCVIGYKITHKASSDSFGEIIADVKPIDHKTKTLCRLIIDKINP